MKTRIDISNKNIKRRNYYNISIDWDKNETTVVKVFSVTGTAVVAKSVTMKKGTNFFVLDELF